MVPYVGRNDVELNAALRIILLIVAFPSAPTFIDAPLLKYGTVLLGLVTLAFASSHVRPLFAIAGFKTFRS